jgi:hypothetical protein
MNTSRRVRAVWLFAGCTLCIASCSRERAPESSAGPPVASVAAPASEPSLPSSLKSEFSSMDAATALKSLETTSRLLDDALALGAPDCGAVQVLRDRICALAARLCQLAAENTTEHELSARCEDAKPRCDRARSRVAGPCG